MVSLMKIFKRYKYFFLLASLFVVGGASQSFAAIGDVTLKWVCQMGKTKCCVNGTKSCCEDNGTLYDTWSCDESSCGLSGRKEYKYTASGCSYTTSTRTCCYNGEWSAWDGVCPAAPKQCTGTRPDSKTTCYGGYKRRTVTCNTSTGTWTTGSWGECDCSDSAYESVTTPSGGRCCQRKDGTGIKCAGAPDLAGHRWVKAGTNCRSRVECGYGSCSGSCSTPGSECTTWVNNGMSAVAQGCAHYDTGDRGICQAYYCQ